MKNRYVMIPTLLLLITLTIYFCVSHYSFVFARTVAGEVVAVERLRPEAMITSTSQTDPALLSSFAVAIREKNGEIVMASAVDRQWAVVEKGKCVRAKYFRYPPWEIEKGGTFFGARLLKMYDCKS